MIIWSYAVLMLVSTFFAAVSQVMLKKAAQREYKARIYEYLNPLVIFAYIIFVVTTFLDIFAYRGVPLSLGPVLEATSYIYVTIFGIKIFGEKMSARKLIALTLIVTGIIIYSVIGN